MAAHADVEQATPAPEGLLAAAPLRLEIRFTEPVAAGDGSPTLQLLDVGGRDEGLGPVEVDPADPRRVTAEMPALGPGTYTIAWAVRSATDGHTLSGSYAFRIAGGRAPGAATVEGETPSAWAVATRWLTFGGAALAAGGVLLTLLAPEAAAARRPAAAATGGTLVALLATLSEPLLQTIAPPAGASEPTLREAIRALPDGWWLRPVCLIVATALAAGWLILTGRARPLPLPLAAALLAAAFGALLGLSLTSHAAGRERWREFAVAGDLLHQWSIALWVGGLVHLALWRPGNLPSAAWPALRIGGRPLIRLARPEGTDPAGDPVRRFSAVALVLVVIGVLTGVINSGFALPAVRALWESTYGRIIIVKVAVLLPALLLATYHRVTLRRTAQTGLSLIRTIRLETAVVALVVLGGSFLALLAPPVLDAEHATTAAPVVDLAAPADPRLGDTGPILRLRVEPVTLGANTVAIFVTEPVATPGQEPPRRPLPPGTTVELTLTTLNTDLAPMPITATADGAGGFVAPGVSLGLAGWWRIEVRVQPPGELGLREEFFLLIPDPNVHGAGAVERAADDGAEAIFDRGLATLTGLHSLRYAERLSDGSGHVLLSEWAFSDGSDGSPVAMSVYGARSALVRIGEREWIRRSDGAWTERTAATSFVPADYAEVYAGATDFRLGRVEEIDGERCRIVSFSVPGTGSAAAWYIWWVGEESGYVRHEAMVASSHYMYHQFTDFDAPVRIEPPVTAATPAASPPAEGTPPATPAPAGSPVADTPRRD